MVRTLSGSLVCILFQISFKMKNKWKSPLVKPYKIPFALSIRWKLFIYKKRKRERKQNALTSFLAVLIWVHAHCILVFIENFSRAIPCFSSTSVYLRPVRKRVEFKEKFYRKAIDCEKLKHTWESFVSNFFLTPASFFKTPHIYTYTYLKKVCPRKIVHFHTYMMIYSNILPSYYV